MKHRIAEVNVGLALGFICTNQHRTQNKEPSESGLSLQHSEASLASTLHTLPSPTPS